MKHSLTVSTCFTLLLFITTACNKAALYENPAEEVRTATAGTRQNANGCAVVTAAIAFTYQDNGSYWVSFSLLWTNQSGKKFIEVISENGNPVLIDASASEGIYRWTEPVSSPYGIFSFRTVTRTSGGSPGDGSVCQDKTWEIAIDPAN